MSHRNLSRVCHGIIYHVLLGLNVYTKSKTQKSDIKSFSDDRDVTKIFLLELKVIWWMFEKIMVNIVGKVFCVI